MRCSVAGCEKAAQTGGKCKTHGGGTRCSVADCNKHAVKGDMCKKHFKENTDNMSDVEIKEHIAPEPMDLLANISVKLEPMETDVDTDVDMVSHKAPDGMNLLSNLAVVKQETEL